MRFHTLIISAFGPFPGTETVDFDALSADGLFLLRGETGSGKTSVLDALTFALYGQVPGERKADQLKSQHAPAERVPSAELEFTRGQDRYRVRRQAVYWRPPKRRGAGPQRVGSELSLRRWEEGDWKTLPVHRIAEADAELAQIIGLKMHEFTKVIMLPQGAFAQLLHASNEERRAILEQLFDIEVYDQLEARLWTQMRQSEDLLKGLGSTIAIHQENLRSTAEAILGDDAPETSELDGAELEGTALIDAVHQAAETRQAELIAAGDAAEKASRQAVEHSDQLQTRGRQLTLWAEHVQRLQAHQAAEPAAQRARRRIAEHQSASGLRDWLTVAEKAHEHQQVLDAAAADAAQQARQALQSQTDITDREVFDDDGAHPKELEAAAAELVELRARLTDQEAAEAEQRHAELIASLQRAQSAAEQAEAQAQELAGELAQQQHQLQALQEQTVDLDTLDDARSAAESALTAARTRAEQLTQLVAARQEAESLAECLAEHSQQTTAAEASYRVTSQAHLQSIAHELAQNLEPGDACLVCGSTEHPDLLQADVETVTRQAVDAAAEALQAQRAQLEAIRADHQTARHTLTTLTDALGEHVGLSLSHAAEQVEHAEQRVADAQTQRRTQRSLHESIQQASETLAQLRQRYTEAGHRAEIQTAEATRLGSEAQALEKRLTALRGGHDSVAARLAALDELHTVLAAAQQAGHRAETAAAERSRAQTAATEQLEKSSFADTEAVLAALCGQQLLEELEATVAAFGETAQQLRLEAEQEDLQAGRCRTEAGEQAPHSRLVTEALEAAEAAEAALAQRRRAVTDHQAQRQGLQRIIDQLSQALTARQEQAAEHLRAAELAKTINGSGENELRMRLTTFVLAGRLERVAEAATRYLNAMTSGRYQLLLDPDRQQRGLRGLDLKVFDEYSAEERPAESLSGGETFITALSMALGLAEVVQAEAGGIGLESLFIDEGFGSLDDQTLEAVMSALHTLQGEGRRVGVVSHVTEMHQQIPAQLRVIKHRNGSTLSMEIPS